MKSKIFFTNEMLSIPSKRGKLKKQILESVNKRIDRRNSLKQKELIININSDNKVINRIKSLYENQGIESVLNLGNGISVSYSGISVHSLNSTTFLTENIDLMFSDKGTLRFNSIGDDEFELSKILVPKGGKGVGSVLMKGFLKLLYNFNDYQFPKIIKLNCSGSLQCVNPTTGVYELFKNPISEQCKFFRKFGFRVYKRFYSYGVFSGVEMMFDDSKMGIDIRNEIINGI